MKKTLIIATIAFALALLPSLAAPAAASDWIFGTGFRIGDVHFSIGYRSGGPYYGGGPAYYYRTRVDLGRVYYGRPHHHEGCYVDQGVHYHGESCPLVHSYFRRHGYQSDFVFGRYSPPYRRGYGGEHRYDRGYGRDYGGGYYERHRDYRDREYRDRHRRDRHRRDRYYDDHRGRGRGHHRHYDGCGHHGY